MGKLSPQRFRYLAKQSLFYVLKEGLQDISTGTVIGYLRDQDEIPMLRESLDRAIYLRDVYWKIQHEPATNYQN